MKRLYRQVFLFAFGIFLMSLVLTGISMALFFDQRERGFLAVAFKHQVHFFKREVMRLEWKSPEALPERLQEMSKDLGWDISYWRKNQLVYTSLSQAPDLKDLQIRTLNESHHLHFNGFSAPEIVLSIYPEQPQKNILWLRIKLSSLPPPLRGPMMAFVLVILFLALGLIPLTRFILKPYKDLQASLNRLAEGHFEITLEAKKYPAFQELVNSFNTMQTRLQQMIQQKQRLVADVSHELRSPLTRLRVILELLQQQQNEPGLLQKAKHEIEELDRIIEDVLELSRLQLQHIPLHKTHIDLTLLLFEVTEQHQDLFESKGFELKVSVPETSIHLEGDAKLLKRVFNNLFSNIVKYVPGASQIDLSLTQQNQQIAICLRDHGTGLPENELQEIFLPFRRIDFSRSRRTGGVGLGLAIVYEIIQAHQGHIIARNPTEGKGLEFLIELPIQLKATA